MIVTDKSAYTPPTCPRCGATATIEWIEIQFSGPAQGGWIPGQFECPNGCVPAPSEIWPKGEIEDPRAPIRGKETPTDG